MVIYHLHIYINGTLVSKQICPLWTMDHHYRKGGADIVRLVVGLGRLGQDPIICVKNLIQKLLLKYGLGSSVSPKYEQST